ncbi:MAG: serine/threonine-protein phosphatase [Desulfobacterium sp.]|nr:serine/threonine-protein phosphatase [Desulfobacterium sp.]
MKTFGTSHIGLVRGNNEDRYLIKETAGGIVLLAVADGICGQPAGELAAEIVIEKLSKFELKDNGIDKQIIALLREADDAVRDRAKENADFEGMGTTLTFACIRNRDIWWGHIGDSRLYLMRDGKPIQMTKDHTMAQFLLDDGEITVEDFKNHHARNFLVKSVGCGKCKPETGFIKVQKGDLIMLTTDGLHGELDDHIIESVLAEKMDIEKMAEALLSRALEAGGKDNITVIVASV